MFFILPKPSRDDKFVEKNASIGPCSRRDSWVMVPKRLGLKKRVGEGESKEKARRDVVINIPTGFVASSY